MVDARSRLKESAPLAVGIELEYENSPVQVAREGGPAVTIIGDTNIHPLWSAHGDGSLRNNGIEFVSKILRSDKEISSAAKVMTKLLAKYPFTDSNRAGVHVHVNVQDLNLDELWNTLVWYLMLEPGFFDFVGGGRERSIYCRPWYAHITGHEIVSFAKNLGAGRLFKLPHRYYSVNTDALGRHGTLEFRHMKSTTNMDRVENWALLLKAFVKFTTQNPNAAKDFMNIARVFEAAREIGLPLARRKEWAEIYWKYIKPLIGFVESAADANKVSPTWTTKATKVKSAVMNEGHAKFYAMRAKAPKKEEPPNEGGLVEGERFIIERVIIMQNGEPRVARNIAGGVWNPAYDLQPGELLQMETPLRHNPWFVRNRVRPPLNALDVMRQEFAREVRFDAPLQAVIQEDDMLEDPQ
jgi:hypothetical protein